MLGICFWREGFEVALGPEQRGEGVAGGREAETEVCCGGCGDRAGKVPDPRHILLKPGGLSALFIAQDRRIPARVAKFLSGSGFLDHQASCVSGVVED